MKSLEQVLRGILSVAAACGIFATFVWPFVVSDDPASATLRVLCVGALFAFLVSLVLLVAARAAGERAAATKD